MGCAVIAGYGVFGWSYKIVDKQHYEQHYEKHNNTRICSYLLFQVILYSTNPTIFARLTLDNRQLWLPEPVTPKRAANLCYNWQL
jgi:hypothetical protein